MLFNLYIQNYVRQFAKLNRPFWNYEDGCILAGLQAMYEATGDSLYLEIVRDFLDRYICDDGTIRWYEKKEYNLDKIPPGRALFFLYAQTGEEKYRLAIQQVMNQILEQPRTESGSFWHKKIYPYQIWLDGLYMASPFYLLYEKYFHRESDYEDILLQFTNARRFLFDESRQLYYHAYDEKKCQFWADPSTGLSPNFWSRAMGWYAMALADCYEMMPIDRQEQKAELKKLWKEMLDGVLQYQDRGSGLFYQLTALAGIEGNYLETSGSAMIGYSLLKGCRIAGFGDEYKQRALQIILGLETRKFRFSDGCLHIDGICAGAGLGPIDRPERDGSIGYYLGEAVVSDEQKGIASIMLLYSEWLKQDKKSNKWHEMVKVQLNDVQILRHGGETCK